MEEKGRECGLSCFLASHFGGSLICMFLKSSLHCEPGFVWSPESGERTSVNFFFQLMHLSFFEKPKYVCMWLKKLSCVEGLIINTYILFYSLIYLFWGQSLFYFGVLFSVFQYLVNFGYLSKFISEAIIN